MKGHPRNRVHGISVRAAAKGQPEALGLGPLVGYRKRLKTHHGPPKAVWRAFQRYHSTVLAAPEKPWNLPA